MAPPAPSSPDLASIVSRLEDDPETQRRELTLAMNRFRNRRVEEKQLDDAADDRRLDNVRLAVQKKVEEREADSAEHRRDMIRDEIRRIQTRLEERKAMLIARTQMLCDFDIVRLTAWIQQLQIRMENYRLYVEQVLESHRKLRSSIALTSYMRDLDENRVVVFDQKAAERLYDGDPDVMEVREFREGKPLTTAQLASIHRGGERIEAPAVPALPGDVEDFGISEEDALLGMDEQGFADIEASIERFEELIVSFNEELDAKWVEIRQNLEVKGSAYAAAVRRSVNDQHDGLFDRIAKGGIYQKGDLEICKATIDRFDQAYEDVVSLRLGFAELAGKLPTAQVALSPATREEAHVEQKFAPLPVPKPVAVSAEEGRGILGAFRTRKAAASNTYQLR